jgi:predicted MFS family arabinose efflux permease
MAASQTVLGLSANVIIAATMLAASSAAFALFNMTAVTMRQRLVPDHLLGRITSLYRTVADGSEALGALAGGVLAAIAGIRATMLIGALPIAAIMVVLSWHHRGAPANS